MITDRGDVRAPRVHAGSARGIFAIDEMDGPTVLHLRPRVSAEASADAAPPATRAASGTGEAFCARCGAAVSACGGLLVFVR